MESVGSGRECSTKEDEVNGRWEGEEGAFSEQTAIVKGRRGKKALKRREREDQESIKQHSFTKIVSYYSRKCLIFRKCVKYTPVIKKIEGRRHGAQMKGCTKRTAQAEHRTDALEKF
jgi:hypothetical protein